MLGPVKPRHLDQAIAVSLDDLIPQDHFNRHLETRLVLGCVRDWAQELYTERGRPSIDPVVFFKLQLGRVCKRRRHLYPFRTTTAQSGQPFLPTTGWLRPHGHRLGRLRNVRGPFDLFIVRSAASLP